MGIRVRRLLGLLDERVEDPVLREHFERETKTLSLAMLRLTTQIGMFLFPLFGTLDIIDFPGIFPILWILRLAEVAFCALIYFSLKTRLVRERTADVGMVLMIFSCLDIVAMCWLTGGPTSVYYAGINLTILVVIFVMILDVKRVLAACAVVGFFFLLPAFLRPAGAAQRAAIVSNSYFLLITMLLAVIWTLLKNRTRLDALKGRLELAKANDDLKKLDTLKSQFFTNISHEVRTPLASIIGPIQSLYLGDAGPFPPEQQGLLESTYRNSLKLLDLINQMLDFSKIEAGKMPLFLKTTDLGARLRDTVATFKEMAERKGLELRFRTKGDVPPVDIDEPKFERVVTNLVRNAIKFTERGSIDITLESVEGRIRVAVEDTGIGIPPEQLPSIFERFRQIDGSSTRRYEGTGIGLAIVKEYVELMRGEISVESQVGRGTRFLVEIPTNLAELVPEAMVDRRAKEIRNRDVRHPIERKTDLGGVSTGELAWMDKPPDEGDKADPGASSIRPIDDRIVLAEDNADLRAYLRMMLTKYGHEVVSVADGAEAWAVIKRDPPDVVVADIMMPRMDGYELLRNIRGTRASMAVPVILITAKPGLDAKLMGLEYGADAYLNKPVSIRELDARIRNLVSIRKFQQTEHRLNEMEGRVEERRIGFERIRRALDSTVQAVAAVIEIRDSYTSGHQKRVADLAQAVGVEMGVPADRLEGLHTAGIIHDIGKIGIPAEILSKPSKLTPIEYAWIQTHPQAGHDVIKDIEFPWPVARMILEHHERIDGSGYPNGRRGDEILLESRILAVADVVEAMSSHRPFRPALGTEAALAEISKMRGTIYDPEVVDACLRLFRDKAYRLPD
jgi:response regulator RpfG family c-di-GMP phosphodiesterase/signal transduction histidine kinase